MRRPVAMLLSVCFLAASAVLAPGHATGPAFSAPVTLPGSDGYEPGVIASTTGTLFANEPGSQRWWRLEDQAGAKWTRIAVPSPASRFPGGFDSDVAVGHDGRVYYFDLSVVSNTLLRSDDDGKTIAWSSPITTIPTDDRAWISVGPKTAQGETVYAVWADFATSYVNFARSEDSGVTFTKQSPAPGLFGASGSTGKVFSDDTGFVAFPFFQSGYVKLAYSLDRGDTWKTSQVSRFQNGLDVIQNVVKVGNALHVVWIDSHDYSVQYNRSDDRGASWLQVPMTIAPPGSNIYPWVAARGDKVAVTYYGSDRSSSSPLDPNSLPATTKWYVKYVESIDGGRTWTTAVNAADTIVLKGDVCTQGISCDTDGRGAARALGDFIGMDIDSHGRSVIVAGKHSSGTGLIAITQQ